MILIHLILFIHTSVEKHFKLSLVLSYLYESIILKATYVDQMKTLYEIESVSFNE